MELPDLRKRYWGRHFWARGYFSTTSGNITDDVILQYLQKHEPTGAQPVVIQFRQGQVCRRLLDAVFGSDSDAAGPKI
jgi:Transposase IS200 like